MIAEIIGPSGRVHYRRPPDDPLVDEARRTAGYSVRLVESETKSYRCYYCGCKIEEPGYCSEFCYDAAVEEANSR